MEIEVQQVIQKLVDQIAEQALVIAQLKAALDQVQSTNTEANNE